MKSLTICVLVSLSVCPHASGQGGIITTVAGNGGYSFSGDGGPHDFGIVQERRGGLAVDLLPGNLFLPGLLPTIGFQEGVSPGGIISTVAGNGTQGFSGDGGPATSAELNSPGGVAVDSSGSLFFADSNNNRIRRVSPSGIITPVAGSGVYGFFTGTFFR